MRKPVIPKPFITTVVAGAVVLAVSAWPTLSSAAIEPAANARFTVTDDQIADPPPPEFIGANHRWLRNGLGMWELEKDRPDPALTEMSERVGLGIVRYPGGTVANLFDWKKAIGPLKKRGCQVGGGFVGNAEPMDSNYGPDEHERYVAAIGAKTQVMAPAALSSTQDLADYVEYMNAPLGTNPNGGTAWAKARADNGHPKPYGVHWWEIGNEPYLGNQLYWRSSDLALSVRQYAFGGTQAQLDQPLGTACDHRPEAGVSDGSPDQSLRVHYPPVKPDSQTVRVAGEVWNEVDDLAEVGPEAKVYTFDAETGWARFGDGVHGAVPAQGASVNADYDSGPHPGFVDFYKAMKEVDPTIQICSSWEHDFVEVMGDEHPYDCVGPHLYARPDVRLPEPELYDHLINLAPSVLGEITDIKSEVARHRPNDPPQIEVSEYGVIPAAGTAPPPPGWAGSLGWTIYLADVTAGMIEENIKIGNISNLNGDTRTPGELFGGADPAFTYTARAHLLEMYSHMVETTPVESRETANPPATGGAGYQALRVLSTRADDGTVRIMVVNRDRELDINTELAIDGLTDGASVRLSTLNAESFSSFNSPEHPDDVGVTTTEKSAPSGPLQHTFPAHSVTLLEVTPA